MTSGQTNSADFMEYDDCVSCDDSDVDSDTNALYVSQLEDRLDDSIEELHEDAFLSIWGKSYSCGSSVAYSVDRDDDLSESEDDIDSGKYSSDEMLSEDSDSSDCDFMKISPSNLFGNGPHSNSIKENVSLPGSREICSKLEQESHDTNMVRSGDYYNEYDESNYLTRGVDVDQEPETDETWEIESKNVIQQEIFGRAHIEEDSDLVESLIIFDEELGYVDKENEEEYLVSADSSQILSPSSVMTSSRGIEAAKIYNNSEYTTFKRAGVQPNLTRKLLDAQQSSLLIDNKHDKRSDRNTSRILEESSIMQQSSLLIDINQDERSIVSDKTLRVRNTSTILEESSMFTSDSTAPCDEQTKNKCITPLVVKSSGEKQRLSMESELDNEYPREGCLSPSREYSKKSYQSANGRSRLFYYSIAVGFLVIATTAFVGTFFGLRKKFKRDQASTLSSARQDKILKRIKSVSTAPTLSDANSPQYAALRLILDDDAMTQDISYDVLIQRYSIAVLFFSWKLGEMNVYSECMWKGIWCKNGVVNRIILRDSSLAGSIPNELAALTSLVTVDLSNNYLESTFPSDIGALTSLSELLLNGNSLTSPVPTNFGHLKKLTVLDIGNNLFTGELLANKYMFIPSLTTLNLSGNGFWGEIPTNLHVLCPNLVQLDINSNMLTGSVPTELGNLISLRYLSISSNKLDGLLSSELFKPSSNIMKFDLSNNDLSGHLPVELFHLTSMTHLSLGINSFSSNIPSQISMLSNLEVLDLYSNYFTGVIPSNLGYLTKLRSLELGHNLLDGSMPTEVCSLRYINLIDLSSDCGGKSPKILCAQKTCCTSCA